MAGWITWTGGPPPDTGGKKVRVLLRASTIERASEQEPQEVRWWRRWTHDRGPGDIVAYQVVE